MFRKFNKKKGQAAVEYLVTYGWAFLAILATIGVLSYFGLFNPNKYIPDRCDFGNQLECQDQFIDNSPSITIRFKNSFEDDIIIQRIYGDDVSLAIAPIDISVGEIKRINIDTTRTLFAGTKESFKFAVEFQRDDGTAFPSTPLHNVSGEIFGEVQANELGLLS